MGNYYQTVLFVGQVSYEFLISSRMALTLTRLLGAVAIQFGKRNYSSPMPITDFIFRQVSNVKHTLLVFQRIPHQSSFYMQKLNRTLTSIVSCDARCKFVNRCKYKQNLQRRGHFNFFSELLQLFDTESSTYTYLLGDGASKVAVLIDPVLQHAKRDLQLVEDLNLKLVYASKLIYLYF